MTLRELRDLHNLSSNNRNQLRASEYCRCFYCGATFPPEHIKEWIDKGKTAVCPKCGIDSVLGSSSIDVTDDLISEMTHYWFHRGMTADDLPAEESCARKPGDCKFTGKKYEK